MNCKDLYESMSFIEIKEFFRKEFGENGFEYTKMSDNAVDFIITNVNVKNMYGSFIGRLIKVIGTTKFQINQYDGLWYVRVFFEDELIYDEEPRFVTDCDADGFEIMVYDRQEKSIVGFGLNENSTKSLVSVLNNQDNEIYKLKSELSKEKKYINEMREFLSKAYEKI